MLVISFNTVAGNCQDLKLVSFKELEKALTSGPDTVKVVNFWATWCKPCVEEIPYFVSAQNEWKDKKVRFIFVSVDFLSQTPKVKEMINRLSLTGTLLQLNERGSEWIDQLDKNWSGAIPYTILFSPNGEKREHYDAFHSYDDLNSFLQKNIIN